LLKRVYRIEALICSHCGGARRVLAAIPLHARRADRRDWRRGADGPLVVNQGVVTLDTNTRPGAFNFTSITVVAAAELRLVGGGPAHLRSRGPVTIDGLLNADGFSATDSNGGNGGPGGCRGCGVRAARGSMEPGRDRGWMWGCCQRHAFLSTGLRVACDPRRHPWVWTSVLDAAADLRERLAIRHPRRQRCGRQCKPGQLRNAGSRRARRWRDDHRER
jgi:hypothetical protein